MEPKSDEDKFKVLNKIIKILNDKDFTISEGLDMARILHEFLMEKYIEINLGKEKLKEYRKNRKNGVKTEL